LEVAFSCIEKAFFATARRRCNNNTGAPPLSHCINKLQPTKPMSRTGKSTAKAPAKKVPGNEEELVTEAAGAGKKATRRSKEEKVSPALLEAAYHVKDFMTDNQKALAYLKAGKQMQDRGAYRWAVECTTEGISCNPSPSLFNARAASYKSLNMWSEAYFDYCFAIRMEPDSGPFHCSRGLVLAKMQRWKLALEDCERAVEMSSTPFHHYCKATVLADCGRNAEAIADLKYCLNFDACPQDLKFKAWFRTGQCQFDLGLYQDAVKSLQLLLNNDPNSVAPRALLARCVHSQER